jgi:hypothetical protein
VKWLFFSSVASKTILAVALIVVLTASLSVGIYLTAYLPSQTSTPDNPSPTPTSTTEPSITPQPTMPSPTASPKPTSSQPSYTP